MGHYNKSYITGPSALPVSYSDIRSKSKFYSTNDYSLPNDIAISNSAGSNTQLLGEALTRLNLPNFNNFIEHGHAEVPSGILGVYSPQKVKLRITRVKPVTSFDDNYKKLYGIPVNKVMSLSGITGFTQLTDFHIEGSYFSECTSDELTALDELLRGGIIL